MYNNYKMKYNKIFILSILCICLSFCISPFFNEKIFAEDCFTIQTNTSSAYSYTISAFGDSISAGFKLEDYPNYYIEEENFVQTHNITIDCFSEVMARQYKTKYNSTVRGFGKTGSKSAGLKKILTALENDKHSEEYLYYKNTNLFTLSIGANDVLGTAMSKMKDYIMGNISDADYRVLLEAGVNDFKTNYNEYIIPKLKENTDATILVMTIYNPYKYTSLTQLSVDSGDAQTDSLIRNTLPYIDINFKAMLSTTMQYLEKINNEIRNSACDSVKVVDIYKMFETFDEEQYRLYINSRPESMVITSTDFNNIDFSSFGNYFDPHPTKEGHSKIAQKFLDAHSVVELVSNSSLISTTNDKTNVQISFNSIKKENETYKVYKNIQNNITLLYSGTDSFYMANTQDLQGTGYVYADLYSNNTKIATSNKINFSYPNIEDTDNSDNPTSQPDDGDSQQNPSFSNNDIIAISCIAGVSAISLIVVIWIIIKALRK